LISGRRRRQLLPGHAAGHHGVAEQQGSIYRKLAVRNRTQAVRLLPDRGWES